MGSTRYIHDVKIDPFLHTYCQEQSTSAKCPILDKLLIKIWTLNFQGIFLWLKKGHPWHQGWPYATSFLSGTLSILQVPPSWPPILHTLLIQISVQKFQGIYLRVKQDHPWHQGWPCPPSILSGTLNVIQVPNKGLPILDTLLLKIKIQNFQGTFLWVKQGQTCIQRWPWPSSVLSGTDDVLQVPLFLTPIIDTFPMKISIWNLQGIFLWVN